jgi:hypothetical protein
VYQRKREREKERERETERILRAQRANTCETRNFLFAWDKAMGGTV